MVHSGVVFGGKGELSLPSVGGGGVGLCHRDSCSSISARAFTYIRKYIYTVSIYTLQHVYINSRANQNRHPFCAKGPF